MNINQKERPATPLCSVIINNYNYAQYVPAAIESVLEQTYERVETIVVDDGSTDNSVEVIERYGERLHLVRKANGGHPSAMNHGFAASSGDIVFFLDADDMLKADIVEKVVRAWTDRTVKIHFHLQHMTAGATPIDGAFNPPYWPLPQGDLREMLERFGFYPSPATSGNAFARRFLERVMPVPENAHSVDTFLIAAAPLFGRVGAITGIGGYWRRHGSNMSAMGLDKLKKKLAVDDEMIRFISRLADCEGRPYRYSARWPQYLKERLLVSKLSSPSKDAESRTSLSLALAYVRSVATWPEYALLRRVMLVSWAVAVLLLPKSVLAAIPRIGGSAIRLS